jgi:uncharacterized membrane protein
MNKGRMEAFSDGVLAGIITIMVLEMKSARGPTLAALKPMLPLLLSYLLSSVHIGIYWNNHHHLLLATQHISGATLWANLYLLSWLSLIPFTTAWMDENHFESWPVAVYGIVLLLAAVAYFILTKALVSLHGRGSTLGSNIYWTRQERQHFNRDLRGDNPAGIRALMDYGRVLYRRRDHVAHPSPRIERKVAGSTEVNG